MNKVPPTFTPEILSQLQTHSTLVSCPGKVLIVGGYLVLDPEYDGLVITTEARLYSWVMGRELSEKLGNKDNNKQEGDEVTIRVKTTQFVNPSWVYSFKPKGDNYCFEEKTSTGKNKFVWSSLDAVYRYLFATYPEGSEVRNKLNKEVDVYLMADNDFYSQREQLQQRNLDVSLTNLSQLPKCNWLGGELQDAHKTGLGSSACLVSSLVGALLAYFLPSSINDDGSYQYSELAHKLAQFAHCRAQGKVGSGFDVASAIYGSLSYRRFNPSLLTDLLSSQETENSTNHQVFSQHMNSDTWDHIVKPVQLPPRFHLALGEVDAGSHTPSLVAKVLAWRQANPEQASQLWNELKTKNDCVRSHLMKLTEFHDKNSKEYHNALDTLLTQSKDNTTTNGEHNSDNSIYKLVNQLKQGFNDVRSNLRKLSKFTGVPVEPQEQTLLLDSIQAIPGVVMAGVPGAGGYDAVFILYIESSLPTATTSISPILHQIQSQFIHHSTTTSTRIGPLLSKEDRNKSGIKLEQPQSNLTIQTMLASVFQYQPSLPPNFSL